MSDPQPMKLSHKLSLALRCLTAGKPIRVDGYNWAMTADYRLGVVAIEQDGEPKFNADGSVVLMLCDMSVSAFVKMIEEWPDDDAFIAGVELALVEMKNQ